MSEEKKKLPPIQPAPVRPFTVRLVDGHFVRVPKLENIAQTDATRPATAPSPAQPPIATAARRDMGARRTLRLVDGRWVRRADLAPDATEVHPPAAHPKPEKKRAPRDVGTKSGAKSAASSEDSWAATFGTEIDPADLPSER